MQCSRRLKLEGPTIAQNKTMASDSRSETGRRRSKQLGGEDSVHYFNLYPHRKQFTRKKMTKLIRPGNLREDK